MVSPSSASSWGSLVREYHVSPSRYPRGSRHIVHRHHVGCVRRLLRVGSCGSRCLRFQLFERLRRLRRRQRLRRLRRADDLCGGAPARSMPHRSCLRRSPCHSGAPVVAADQSVFYAAAGAASSRRSSPAPLYVVNQGPEYSGPGIMMPYRTWSPAVRGPRSTIRTFRRGYWLRPPLLWHGRALRLSRAWLRPSALAVPAPFRWACAPTHGASRKLRTAKARRVRAFVFSPSRPCPAALSPPTRSRDGRCRARAPRHSTR